MASKTRIEDTRGKIDFSQEAEPTLINEQTQTGWFLINYLVKGINWLKKELGKKADDSQSIDYDLSAEPAETGTKSKTANTLWQNLFNHNNFLWLKLKGLFPLTQATTHNYLPKIDNANKKLVKSNIQDDGSRVQIDSPLRVNSKTFYNVAQRNISGDQTGTIYIELPFGWTSNMGTYEIDFYNYSQDTKAKIIVSGYSYSSGSSWVNTSLQIVGNLPSNIVRLGYNSTTSKCCILIGNTNTVWSHPQVYVSKVTQGHTDTADWSTGWSISTITDETNITNIVQPTANVGMMLDGKTLTDQIADNDDRYLGLTATAADSDLLDGNEASYFATSTHNHDGTYSTTDTKNTAGATNTSSKIYLVGSTEQSENPQTYTHDTAYVDVDGTVYSGNSKTITNSDLLTNQIVTPTLNPTWTVRNYAGTVISSPTNPSGEAITGTNIVLEYGFKPSMTVKGKWITQVGYDDPISCSGLCGTSLPASNIETAATSSINLYNSTTYSSTTFPITTSSYWTISTPKKGITVSGGGLVLPIGSISASARTQVTYQLPVYYGNVTDLPITEDTVEGLLTKTWKNYQANSNSKSESPTINATDSHYWIYAYPAAWGDLSTISNADGDWMAAFTSDTVNITGAPGLPILYKYYITVNKGAFKGKTIYFS